MLYIIEYPNCSPPQRWVLTFSREQKPIYRHVMSINIESPSEEDVKKFPRIIVGDVDVVGLVNGIYMEIKELRGDILRLDQSVNRLDTNPPKQTMGELLERTSNSALLSQVMDLRFSIEDSSLSSEAKDNFIDQCRSIELALGGSNR